MAIKRVEIRPKDSNGNYNDVVYPKTSADMVEYGSGTAEDELDKIDVLSDEFDSHKGKRATANQLGHIRLSDLPSGGVKTQRFVIGTSTAGWTEDDVDYLCDGTDDQVEIQQAINDLPSDGGEILLLEGTYLIKSENNIYGVRILNKDNVSIRGVSKNSTVIKLGYNLTSQHHGLLEVISGSNIVISDLKIDGNADSFDSTNNQAIYIGGNSKNVEVSKVHIDNITGRAISFMHDTATNGKVLFCTFTRAGRDGVFATGEYRNTLIMGNSMDGNIGSIGLTAVRIEGGSNCAVIGNRIIGRYDPDIIGDSAISSTSSSNLLIANNSIEGKTRGIRVNNTTDSFITDNLLRDCPDHGIWLFSNSNTGLFVTNNHLNGSNIQDGGGSNNTINNNKT